MAPGPEDAAIVRALVGVHRTAQGALWVDVQSLGPQQDLGRVPLSELTVLLEALVAGAGPRLVPSPGTATGQLTQHDPRDG